MEAPSVVELLGSGKAPHEVLVAVEARRRILLQREGELMRWAAALEAQVHVTRSCIATSWEGAPSMCV
jgi:hypothetical protein